MYTFYNYITLGQDSIDNALDFYLIQSGNRYELRASPQAVYLPGFLVMALQNDPFTRACTYWHLTREQVDAAIIRATPAFLCPNNELLCTPLTGEQVEDIFLFNPLVVSPNTFGTEPTTVEPVSEIERSLKNNMSLEERRALISRLFSFLKDTDGLKQRAAVMALSNITYHVENLEIIDEVGIHSLVALLTNPNVLTRQYITCALANLAMNDENSIIIQQAGGIKVLIDLLQSSSDMLTKQYITCALGNLAMNDENSIIIQQAGGIKVLIDLLQSSGDMLTKRYITCALANLALNDENRIIIQQAGSIAPLIDLLQSSSDMLTKQYITGALANLVLNDENSIIIQQTGGIAPLIELLQSSGDMLTKRYITLALLNLAVNDENSIIIQQAGGIAPLIELLQSSGDMLTKQYITGALANLVLNDENRIIIQQAGGIEVLIPLLQSTDDVLTIRSATKLLAVLTCAKDGQKRIGLCQGVKALLDLLTFQDQKIQQYAVRALSNLIGNEENETEINHLINAGHVTALLTQDSAVRQYVVNILVHLELNWTGFKITNQLMLKLLVKSFVALLKHSDPKKKEHAAKMLRILIDCPEVQSEISQCNGLGTIWQLLSEKILDAKTTEHLTYISNKQRDYIILTLGLFTRKTPALCETEVSARYLGFF